MKIKNTLCSIIRIVFMISLVEHIHKKMMFYVDKEIVDFSGQGRDKYGN